MKLPHIDFTETQDQLVRAYMLGLGISEELLKQGALSKGPSTAFYDHESPEHWILIMRCSGCTPSSENGLIMWGWLKANHSEAIINHTIQQFTRSTGGAAATRKVIPRNRN